MTSVVIIKQTSRMTVNLFPINLVSITTEVIHTDVEAKENAMAVPSASPP